MSEKRFYVYLHRRSTDGSVFYVGKGTGARARNFTHRSEWWKRIAAKYGVVVDVFKDGMSETCALTLEKIAIHHYGRDALCNLSDGGDGVSNPTPATRKAKSEMFSGLRNPQANRDLVEFWHESYGKVTCTQFLLRKIFGVESSRVSSLVKGNIKSSNGWFLFSRRHLTSGKSGPNVKTKHLKETYIHDDGTVFIGNFVEFREKFGGNKSNIYKMRAGMTTKYRGWRMDP